MQHIALATNDILHTVNRLREQGIEFLRVPHTYYTELQQRVGKIDEPVDELEAAGHPGRSRRRRLHAADLYAAGGRSADAVLRDHSAQGSRSFGKGNFKALFEAIEREQQARGNL